MSEIISLYAEGSYDRALHELETSLDLLENGPLTDIENRIDEIILAIKINIAKKEFNSAHNLAKKLFQRIHERKDQNLLLMAHSFLMLGITKQKLHHKPEEIEGYLASSFRIYDQIAGAEEYVAESILALCLFWKEIGNLEYAEELYFQGLTVFTPIIPTEKHNAPKTTESYPKLLYTIGKLLLLRHDEKQAQQFIHKAEDVALKNGWTKLAEIIKKN